MSNPIFIATHYLKRVPAITSPRLDATAVTKNGAPEEFGYHILPGRIVDVFVYNSTNSTWQFLGKFFQPYELPVDARLEDFLLQNHSYGAGDGTNHTDAAHACGFGFRLKFTNGRVIPFFVSDSDRGIVSGYFDQGVAGLKIEDIAFSSGDES